MEISLQNGKPRNYGIDLLRIIAMYMIIILHLLGGGGILDNCVRFSLNYYLAWFIEASVYCAVNVFAMITGYVMVNTNFNGFKILPLWLTVFFYSAIFTILFKFVPSFSFLHEVSVLDLIKGIFFPVVSKQYWYFTSYFGMYFFIPYINKLLNIIEKKEHRNLCITIIAIFSILPVFGLKRIDSFDVGWGYTTLWLTCLYILGAYCKLYPIKISKLKCLVLYFISFVCAWIFKLLSHILIKLIFSLDKELDLFIDYTSIFIIISGIALLLLFAQIDISNVHLQKSIGFISGLSFSVYLIHTQKFVFDSFLRNRFSHMAAENAFLILVKLFLYALLIFIICILIDVFRYLFFKISRVQLLPKKLFKRIKTVS